MRYLILNIILSLGSYICLSAEDIKCNKIRFQLTPIAEADTSVAELKFKLNVLLDLAVTEPQSDTLKLQTAVKIAQGLGPENLTAYIKEHKKNIPLSTWVHNQTGEQPFMDNQTLNILLPNKEDYDITVSYDVIGTGFFFYIQQLNYPHVFAYHYNYEQYYPLNLPIDKVEICTSDSIQTFYSHSKNEDEKEEINLTFINKNYFKQEIFNTEKIKLNVFTPDSLVSDTTLTTKKRELVTYLGRLTPLISNKKALDLILLNWRDDKNRRAFGRAFGTHCICDHKFPSNSMFHEILHMAFPCKVKDMSKGEYFVKECIIEWLTLCLTDKLNLIKPTQSTRNMNLYDTHINSSDTWDLIYLEGPEILQTIATKSSEEQLAKGIISFLQLSEGKTTDYDSFISHLEKYLSPDLIEELDLMVKGKDHPNN